MSIKLTKKESKWLIEEFEPKMGGRVDGDSIRNYFAKAREILLRKKITIPGCSCEWKPFVLMTKSLFNQYKPEILKVYESKRYKNETTKKDMEKNADET